jgi:hypothetical protein
MQSAPDEGSLSAETDPSPVSPPLRVVDPPSPTRGEGNGGACGAFVLDNFPIRISNSRFIVIASEAKQSISLQQKSGLLRRYAPRNDGESGVALPHNSSSYPAKAGYPVRRGLSIPSLTSLEYWIARSSRAMTVECVAIASLRSQ